MLLLIRCKCRNNLLNYPSVLSYFMLGRIFFLKKHTQTLADSKNSRTFASLLKKSTSRWKFWRDGRVVDRGGLENRCTERYRGFESLSLRSKGCKSSSYEIYTRFYTQKTNLDVFFETLRFAPIKLPCNYFLYF